MKKKPFCPEDHVSYRLHIRVHRQAQIVAGALGSCNFSPGDYAYTGSARRNLEARVARHLSPNKKLRWHIDYLLVHPDVEVISVETSSLPECRWNQQLKGSIPVPGFGASDCRNHCGSHLKRIGRA